MVNSLNIILSKLRSERQSKIGEIVRFCIVGGIATLLQYGAYLLLLCWLRPTPANTAGYLLGFLFNYIATTRFTFRVKPTARRGVGFVAANVVNYLLQTLLLAIFLRLGIPKQWALVPVLCICVPVNFVLVRWVMKKGKV